jgi:hypothetical protein
MQQSPLVACAQGGQIGGERLAKTPKTKHFLLKKPSFFGLAWCLLAMSVSENLLVQVRLEGSIDTIG